MNRKIHILGGGPAGMAASYYAKINNLDFTLYEASNSIGGNCKTIKIEDFLFDLGAHRFHDKDSKVTNEIKKLLKNDLLDVDSPSKIFWEDKFFDFPLRIIDILLKLDLKTNTKIIFENIINKFNKNIETNNFKNVAYQNYGKTLSDLFLMNYTQKLWGKSCDQLLPEISGGRLKNLNLKSVLKEFIFNDKLKSKHLDGKFLYPRFGYGSIFESIKAMHDSQDIQLNSSITKLIHNNSKIEKVIINNKDEFSVNNLISTLPVNLVIKMLEPKVDSSIIEIADSLSFRGLKLCAIFLDIDRCSDNASIYFPDKNIPFTRLYEPKNRSQNMAPKNKTCIVIEVPFDQNKKNKDDDYIMNQVIEILIDKKIIKRKNILFNTLIDMSFAYPVLTLDVKDKLDILVKFLNNFNNLHLLGRNAQFKYLHTHDLFLLSNEKIQFIKKQITNI